ncbi:MAG: TonB-dependent receptor [Sinobacteraceae bacterium]|nr:TonB-dependent receptor [Nevskiaceae bacterium]
MTARDTVVVASRCDVFLQQIKDNYVTSKLGVWAAVALAMGSTTAPVPTLAQQGGAETGTSSDIGTGSVSGKVTHEVTGTLLEGASIRIVELGREAVVGRDGTFSIRGVPAGTWTVVAQYVGVDSQRRSVTLPSGGNLVADFALRAATEGLDEVLVTSRASGRSEALSLQRTAPTYRTVVSADALGQMREGNIGDALVRLPSLSVETRAGVQRTATIRGLAPQYNTVTVNGLRMTNVDGNRDIALDSFPSNMLARVEVVKANTPSLPSDAIGGTVDLITRSAFDRSGATVEAEIGGTHNDLRGNWNRQAVLTLGDTFGANDQFGLLGSVAFYHDERGYDVVESAYTYSPIRGYLLTSANYYDRYEVKDKIGGGFTFDFRPEDGGRYFLRSVYSYDYRDLNHYGTIWRPGTVVGTDPYGDVVATTGGRVDVGANYREPKNVFQMHSVGGQNSLGEWALDYQLAWSRAKKDYPETINTVNSFNGVDLTYDRSSPDFPTFAVTNGVDVTNPAALAFRTSQITQVPRVEDELSWDVNLRRDLVLGGHGWSFVGGARLTQKDASQAQPRTSYYGAVNNGATPASMVVNRRTPGFLADAGDTARSMLLRFYPDWQRYDALARSGSGLAQSAAQRVQTAETIANADFDIGEDILGLYTQATAQFGNLEVLAGLRWERTKLDSRANRVVTNSNVVTSTPVSASNSYDNLLPGLHLRYTPTDRLVFRGSVSQALSRPPPGDLIPSVQENPQINQRVIGNPDLKPAEALNLDLSAEYYLPPLGVLSASLFHKDIDNFVFSESRFAADGVDERTRVNGDGGKVLGLELTWNQQLTFLPAPFDGLGVELNYTRLDSEGKYPGRTSEKLSFINSPDYILNGILSYARGPFDLRVSYNKLPERLEAVGASAAQDRYYASSGIWDLAGRYRLPGNYQLFVNVKNLSDEPTVSYLGSRDNPVSVVYFGRQYNLGVQYRF